MTVAELVNMPGNQLFAGAGFADDQYAGVAWSYLLQVRQ